MTKVTKLKITLELDQTFKNRTNMTSKTIVDYIERIKNLYTLIRSERTGTRKDLARRLYLSIRTVSVYLSELKALGAEIAYDKIRKTYYFVNEFTLIALFEVKIAQ